MRVGAPVHENFTHALEGDVESRDEPGHEANFLLAPLCSPFTQHPLSSLFRGARPCEPRDQGTLRN